MPTILVVEDDKAVQEMLKDLLTRHGNEVRTCRDGEGVLAELSRHAYDLMILDVLIPRKNGFVLIAELRATAELRDLPVIMISGIYRSHNHRAEMLEQYGVVEYLDKPFSGERLLEAVKRALAGPAAGPPTTPQKLASEDLDDLLAEVLSPDGAREGTPARPVTRARDVKVSAKLVDASTRDERRQVESSAREAFKKGERVIQGAIATTRVPAVLGMLWQRRVTGGLLLRRDKIKKIVYLKNGDPFSVKSNLVTECLGQILLKERLITRAQCEQSVERLKGSGARQGEILVQMGALTQKNLDFALELQLETKLFETFTWDDGEYRFTAAIDLVKTPDALPWTGPALVVEGLRRTLSEFRLTRLLAPLANRKLTSGAESVEAVASAFNEREQQAIAALRLPRTAGEILRTVGLPTADGQRLLYALMALGVVRPEE